MGGDLPDPVLSEFPSTFVGTLFAHLQTHDITKLAIRRPGLADAGSAIPVDDRALLLAKANGL